MRQTERQHYRETQDVYWDQEDLLRRLRRIEGQVRGIQAMVARRETCRDILTQVAAVEGAMRQVSRIVSACNVAEELSHLAPNVLGAEAVQQALGKLVRRP